jgi:hypothetical protein
VEKISTATTHEHNHMDLDRKLYATETAAFFGITERTLTTWQRDGKVPQPEFLPNGRRFWRQSVLQACIKTTAPPAVCAAA